MGYGRVGEGYTSLLFTQCNRQQKIEHAHTNHTHLLRLHTVLPIDRMTTMISSSHVHRAAVAAH